MKRKRPLIAAIFPAVHDDCQSIVWPGVADFAAEHNIDLLTFIATSQNKVATFQPHYNIVQGLTRPLELDGLIVYTGAFSDHFNADQLTAFCRSLNRCPILCISQKVDGFKTILINNEIGVRQTVKHLIEVHGCRTFAFVRGHENHTESEERFRAFRDELASHGLSLDPGLVFPGHFIKESGIEAARRMLSMKKLPDAVLAVNDSTALGILSEFAKNHVRVPGDICVAGFDDVPEARNHVPSLTTVAQPLYAIGQVAAQTLLRVLEGAADTRDVFVPTEFLARQSCGCITSHSPDSGFLPGTVTSQKLELIRSKKQLVDYCADLVVADNAEIRPATAAQWIDELLACLKDDVSDADADGVPNRFIERLTVIMVQHISANGGASVWQDILSTFSARWRSLMRAPESAPVVEDVFNRARMTINDFILRMNLAAELAQEDSRALIRNIMLSLITAFDLDRLKNVLKDNLPKIGINGCHLVLYGADREGLDIADLNVPEFSELVLSFSGEKTYVDVGDSMKFETRLILPEKVWADDRRKNHLLFPIVFETRTYGYAIFERGVNLSPYVYEELRIHIGNALRGHNLVNDLREMSLRDELTGLYNRRGFIYLGGHLVSQARRKGSAITMMYGDMDRLKYINDTFGHAEGDFAIAKCAELLISTIRDQDIVARIGGDEFTIIAQDMTERGAQAVVKRISSAFDKFNATSNKPYRVAISVGYSHQPDPEGLSIGEMLENADQMLGRIKRDRRAQ